MICVNIYGNTIANCMYMRMCVCVCVCVHVHIHLCVYADVFE